MNQNQQSPEKLSGWLTRASKFVERSRYETGAIKFVFVIALVNAGLFPLPLYSFALADLDDLSFTGIGTLITLIVAVFTVTAAALFLVLLLTHRLVKPLCMLVALANSISLYFVVTYQVVLDKSMMGERAKHKLRGGRRISSSEVVRVPVSFWATAMWAVGDHSHSERWPVAVGSDCPGDGIHRARMDLPGLWHLALD